MKLACPAILICVLLFCSWVFRSDSHLGKAKWLIGTWENKRGQSTLFETWKEVSDTEFQGISFVVKEGDTIIFETIQLVQEMNGLVYIPTVQNQNNGLPVRFISSTLTDVQMIFVNDQHDFPQNISYTLVGPDSLLAEISGMKNGQIQKQSFSMKKVK